MPETGQAGRCPQRGPELHCVESHVCHLGAVTESAWAHFHTAHVFNSSGPAFLLCTATPNCEILSYYVDIFCCQLVSSLCDWCYVLLGGIFLIDF